MGLETSDLGYDQDPVGTLELPYRVANTGPIDDLMEFKQGCERRAQHLLDEVAKGYLSMEMTYKEFDGLIEQIDAIETEIDDLRRQR